MYIFSKPTQRGLANAGLLILVVAVWAGFTAACTSAPVETKSPPKPDLRSDGPVRNYRLQVDYFNQDNFGRTKEIVAYDCRIGIGHLGDQDVITWEKYDRAQANNTGKAEWGDFAPDIMAAMRFTPYPPGSGLQYLWGSADFDLGNFAKIPGIKDAPKDLTGFQLYLHAIDLFSAYKVYPTLLAEPARLGGDCRPLERIGDRIFTDQRNNALHLMDWENVGRDLVMQTGFMEFTYLADTELNGQPVRLIGFQQNQRFGQTLTYQGFVMPMDETTRFMGHIWLAADGSLEKIEFQEYVYVLVHAPMFIKEIAHTKRHFVLEREPPVTIGRHIP